MMMQGSQESMEEADNQMAKSTFQRNSRIVYIAGMSGIGKTKLSVEAAKLIGNAEVINMDSLQVYKVEIRMIRVQM